MKIFKILLSFIYPQTIEIKKSKVNKIIRIEYYFGYKRIAVGGYTQSGIFAQNLLTFAFRNFKIQKDKIKKVLILGLGGGSMLEVLDKYLPEYKAIGVDLDPEMVNAGIKHLSLKARKNLKVYICDALKFIQNKENGSFDLIISDLYIGLQTHPKLQGQVFINNIFRILAPEGLYISNSSHLQKQQKDTIRFLKKLQNTFINVETKLNCQNLIILARKSTHP